MPEMYSIDEIRRIAAPIAVQFGVKKMALFGSYARGEQKAASDIDFVIDKGSIQGLEFFGFLNRLEDALGVPVDVLTYQSFKDSFCQDTVKDEVVLYEG